MPWHGPDGSRLHYEDSGRGDTVVLLPGWGGSIADLNLLRAALSEGFRVIAIDLPGSGRSEPQPRHYPVSYYRDDARTLLAVLDSLGVGAAHLVGFSDGGEEALLLAELRPSLALSVLTWGAAGRIEATPEQLDAIAGVIDHPAPELTALAAYLAEAYGPQHARTMTSSWAGAMRGIIEAGGDISRRAAGRITCPALLIAGSYDPFCPPELVEPMASAIPRGQFREAPGAGHDVHHSHHGWLAGVLSDWLAAH
jgi:valacyclovir hydrolase